MKIVTVVTGVAGKRRPLAAGLKWYAVGSPALGSGKSSRPASARRSGSLTSLSLPAFLEMPMRCGSVESI